MPRLALLTGIILVLLGFIFYFMAEPDHRSVTALIPAFLGIFIAAGGIVAMHPARTKAGMHVAAGFALFGVLGSLMGAKNWPAILSGGEVARPLAAWAQLLLFLICGVFVARCFKWFVDNRRAKATAV